MGIISRKQRRIGTSSAVTTLWQGMETEFLVRQSMCIAMLRGAFVATSKTFLLASQISNLVLFYHSAPEPSCRVRSASKVVLRSCISLSFLGQAGLSSVQSTDCHAAILFSSLFMTSCFPSFPHSSSHSHLFHYHI